MLQAQDGGTSASSRNWWNVPPIWGCDGDDFVDTQAGSSGNRIVINAPALGLLGRGYFFYRYKS